MATAADILKVAESWLGYSEANGKFKKIIDTYNAFLPRARGYKVRYSDEWCATFVSACAIKANATAIIPTECSCNYMIAAFKKIGCWVENDGYTPRAGDIIFYDWQDSGAGDNVGGSDHVGIVENVSNGVITVIEGNKNEAVAKRTIKVNGRYIRGYGAPKYDRVVNNTPENKVVETKAKFDFYGLLFEVDTINRNGSNYVNLRQICDVLGVSIEHYDPNTKVITLKLKD